MGINKSLLYVPFVCPRRAEVFAALGAAPLESIDITGPAKNRPQRCMYEASKDLRVKDVCRYTVGK